MLETRFGNIKVMFDGEIVPVFVSAIKIKQLFPDVDGAFLLKYVYTCDGRAHALRCVLDGCGVTGGAESGEGLEAISFYENSGKLTIGCEGWFGDPEESCYDYGGSYLDNGLEIEISPNTKSREFLFGVAWLNHCTDENDVQTWFAADPTSTYHDTL